MGNCPGVEKRVPRNAPNTLGNSKPLGMATSVYLCSFPLLEFCYCSRPSSTFQEANIGNRAWAVGARTKHRTFATYCSCHFIDEVQRNDLVARGGWACVQPNHLGYEATNYDRYKRGRRGRHRAAAAAAALILAFPPAMATCSEGML